MRVKVIITVTCALAVIVLGVAFGSVWIPPGVIWEVITYRIMGTELPEHVSQAAVAIVWNLRLPRTLLAFVVGAALSVSGAVMQSVLRNPLASSYTLGVSSGASLGAGVVILYGVTIPLLGAMSLPLLGFAFGLGTIVLVISFASRIDGRMENNTIILTGMVFSLFVNALTTLLSALQREHLQRLVLWQMGSFSMRDWQAVFILAPIAITGALFVAHYNRELDMMTFGEEQAKTMGVNLKRVKWLLLIVAAAITGSSVAFVGVIGFVDLVAPHIVRRIFGVSHRYVVPLSAVFGGAFMVLCDLVARTVVSPSELPVGAVSALVGAPFFAYIYFARRTRSA
ncbi:MAG: iron ABC transporter permease [Oscillospiraceae bacterium]|nr:iron ABC transporter permease [Oscillospiraceae bacterium]